MNHLPLPTPKQEQWANMEMGVIIHHVMETYHPEIPGNLWRKSQHIMTADTFAPTDENTDQWLETAAKAGAKYAVLVTNHVSGFSLWPTKQNGYSIASSPYKGGKADVVADFIASCKRYGIAPGLYYSTGCNSYYRIDDSDKAMNRNAPAYREYVAMVNRQLSEIWGNYGELFELWFDGGVIPKEQGGPDVPELIRKYQPDALCFQGPKEHHQNLRWVGNEDGVAPMDCWSTASRNTCGFDDPESPEAIGVGNPDGPYWIPAETDMASRKQQAYGGGWYWKAGEEHLVYSAEELMNAYLTSVGRNSNLLLGMCIDQRGHFPEADARQFIRFGEMVKALYANPRATCRGTGTDFSLRLDSPERIEYIVLGEDIHYGQRVRAFSVDVETAQGTRRFFEARSIGHKRIIPVGIPILGARLRIHAAADTPILREMALCARP